MKSQLLKQIRSIFSPKQVQLNKRILYFLVFLTISTVIWFFNKLEKNYFSQIEITVQYFNFPKNVIQTEELPNKITVSIFGRGFTILRYKFLSTSTFYIDLKKHLNATYKGNETVFLYTENLISSLDKELSEEVKIIQIEPKSIKFSFAQKSVKKLPVVAKAKYQLAPNYLLIDFSVKPNFAIITGPSEILDTLDTLYTTPIYLTNLQQNTTATTQIQAIRNCEVSPKTIELELKVDKKTEKIIKINTSRLIQGQENIQQILPDQLTLKCHVAVSKFKEINVESFDIQLVNSDIKNAKIVHYYPRINQLPIGVTFARFEPEYFTVIYH